MRTSTGMASTVVGLVGIREIGAIVERIVMLQLRCAALDRKIIDGTFSEYDSKVYLAFSNSLTRALP